MLLPSHGVLDFTSHQRLHCVEFALFFTNPNKFESFNCLQKKVVRIIARKNHDAHTDPIFKDLEILKFNCICRFHVSKMLFQLKNNVLTSAFSSIFLFNYQMHGYFTRTSKQFHIPKIRTNIKKFSICCKGPKIFNSLPTDIQFSNALSSFSCKQYKFPLSQ